MIECEVGIRFVSIPDCWGSATERAWHCIMEVHSYKKVSLSRRVDNNAY